jgi:magnesium transporter
MDLPTATPSASRASGRDGRGARHLIGARGVADVPIVLAEARVSEALASVRRAEFAYSGHVVVVDGLSRMVGVAAVERLLREPGDALLASVAGTVPTVTADTPEESAATVAAHRRSPVIGVCGRDGVFLGLVPPETLLEILAAEHEDDMARFGGYLARSAQVRSALEESLVRRLWHRLPWLLLGLLGAMASALLTASFEVQLAQVVAVAFFVPAVVYLADAVGTQTEALIVRGLSVGTSLRASLRLEALTGPMLGLLLAVVGWPAIWLALGDAGIATTVSIALVAACSVATVVAAVLPVLMARSGRDPAFGSGPLATVIQDLLSLVIYFAAAVLVLE